MRSSTIATWYHPDAVKKMESMGVSTLSSQKRRKINRKQRPRIIVEKEHFPTVYVGRQNKTGLSIIKSCLEAHGSGIEAQLSEVSDDIMSYKALLNVCITQVTNLQEQLRLKYLKYRD